MTGRDGTGRGGAALLLGKRQGPTWKGDDGPGRVGSRVGDWRGARPGSPAVSSVNL